MLQPTRERFVEQMKTLPEGVQLELVKSIKEVFEGTLEVPFETLETLSTPELVCCG